MASSIHDLLWFTDPSAVDLPAAKVESHTTATQDGRNRLGCVEEGKLSPGLVPDCSGNLGSLRRNRGTSIAQGNLL